MTQPAARKIPAEPNFAPWIPTLHNRKFDLLNPDPADVDIEDIAASLAGEPRFTGRFGAYSVAQHSYLVSYHCKNALAGLLHDANEAYTGDLPSPVKAAMLALGFDFNNQLLPRIDAAIAAAFGLNPADFHSADVKAADYKLLATEKRDLLPRETPAWSKRLPMPLKRRIGIWTADYARRMFLDRFTELTANRRTR